MNTINIAPALRILFIIGAFIYLGLILWLLKKQKLNVQYSIIWLSSAAVFLIFAFLPNIVAMLTIASGVDVVSNFVFILLFVFVLLLLLSLSTIVTGFASKIKKLTQTQALLEKRVRELEEQLIDTKK